MKIVEILGSVTSKIGFHGLFIIGIIVFVLGTIIFLLEISGYTFKKTGIRKHNLKWDSIDVSTTAMCAALLGGTLAATGGLTIIPGFTWLRPANVLIIIFGILFGIPGCLGAAIGNVIADTFSGYLSFASIGGFIGTFFEAYIPYKMIKDPSLKTTSSWVRFYIWAVLISAIAVSFYISWWGDLLNIMPSETIWTVLFNFIILNALIPTAILGPILLPFLYPKVVSWGMFWKDRIKISG